MIINGKRSLAYIAQITDINPIPDADNIEVATINDGWKVVISKNDSFKVGDEVIYIEIDSKVPEVPEFAFLESRKYRVKTIKLRGQFSQGLIISKSVFPKVANKHKGDDVTDLLGITYYVAEDNQRKNFDPNRELKSLEDRNKKLKSAFWWKFLIKREWGRKILFKFFLKKNNREGFPTKFKFVFKTDEERCENIADKVLGYKNPLIVTEKLDGTSCTYILEHIKKNKFKFYVCSRNYALPEDDSIYWQLAKKYNIEESLKRYLTENPDLEYVCIQGEGVGSVQDNPLKLKENELFLFNFIRSDVGRLDSISGQELAAKYGFKWVPILDTNYYVPLDMEEFKLYADGKSKVTPSVLREGIVLRDPKTDFSFKNVSRKYLSKKS